MLKRVILICIFVLIVTGILMIPVQSGFLLTNTEEEPFHFFPWDGDFITIGWRHSVELTPWMETYHITDSGELSFKSTTYKSYGAGTPDTDGNVEFLTNGYIRVTGIERTIPYFSLYYVPISEFYMRLGSKKYPLSQYVPEYINVQIHYKKIRLYEWIWMKINY